MKKAKINSNKKIDKKEEKIQEEEFSVKKLVIALVSIVVVFVGFYFLTDYLLSKRTSEPLEPVVNANEITFNNILKQKEKTYYVLAVLPEDKHANNYSVYTKELSPVYTIDMKDAFNKSHIGEETKVGDTVKDITISDSALFVIKDGKIDSYYVGHESIQKYTSQSKSE